MKVRQVAFYRQSFSSNKELAKLAKVLTKGGSFTSGPQKELAELADTLVSGWITTGPKVRDFEEKLRLRIGSPNAIAVSSCTAALHLILKAAGIGPGDEVVTTPYTFAATSEAILYTGATPVYCDIDYDSLNMTSLIAERKITRKTKALLPVHIAGLPVQMEGFVRLAREKKIWLFDDAAHALGAQYKGQNIGTIGDASAFSFYAVKNLTSAEGGLVTTRHKRLAEKIRLLSLHGMSKGAWNRYGKGGSWRYDLRDLGFKYNLSDLHAAVGLAQLEKFDDFQERRRKLAERYMVNLGDLDAVRLPATDSDSLHAWHIFILRLRLNRLKMGRDRFILEMNKAGIGTSVHFIPMFHHSWYRCRLKLSAKDFPNAEKAFREVITLPFYPSLKTAEIDYVCEVIAGLCRKYRR